MATSPTPQQLFLFWRENETARGWYTGSMKNPMANLGILHPERQSSLQNKMAIFFPTIFGGWGAARHSENHLRQKTVYLSTSIVARVEPYCHYIYLLLSSFFSILTGLGECHDGPTVTTYMLPTVYVRRSIAEDHSK